MIVMAVSDDIFLRYQNDHLPYPKHALILIIYFNTNIHTKIHIQGQTNLFSNNIKSCFKQNKSRFYDTCKVRKEHSKKVQQP